MNLFWKRLFRTLESTAKTEAYYQSLIEAHKRYHVVAKSKELEEYKRLFEIVKSSKFKEQKKIWVNRKYRDTQEYRDMRSYKRYAGSAHLRFYYENLENEALKEFLDFKKTNNYKKLGIPSEVKKSPDLKRLKKYEKSAAYKNYTRFHNSYVVQEFERLKVKIATEEFQKSNAFWENSRRWETTEEYAVEHRYFALADSADIQFYLNTDPKQFSQLDILHQTFRDTFDGKTLDTASWESRFYYPKEVLKPIHSFANEKQANTGGNNLSVQDSCLRIETRQEKHSAIAWDATKGFTQKEFNYTSDIVHGRNAVYQKTGLFRAKIRFEGTKPTQAFCLKGDGKTPHINICLCNGKSIEVGVFWKSRNETKYVSRKITGIKPSEYYIYTLIWTSRQLVWYINNLEVFRTSEGVPSEPVYPQFSAFIPENRKGGAGCLKVDWIEVYSKNK
ncbi:MAG: glycoside hydrolase family 16 protein [Prevotellaceae bacterium]|jgi:hypothetical protein|nr:glycoside hydrolase family 16 protein [Prevotellaceae bacterium]